MNALDQTAHVGVLIQCVNVQVHVKQETNSRKLLGKLDRKPSALPDIEDCGKCPDPLLRPSCSDGAILKYFLLSLSGRQDVSAVSLGALGRRTGCSELPPKTGEEAASSGANSDLRGGQTRRGGRGRVPAHTEAKQRLCPRWCRIRLCWWRN